MNQKKRILEFLMLRQPDSVTNVDLNKICFRYGARIMDLRREGFDIESIPPKDGGPVWRFKLWTPRNHIDAITLNLKEELPIPKDEEWQRSFL